MKNGKKYSLMDIYNYCLLTEPTGLGYSYNIEYEQLGNTFITNLRKIEKGQINGIINFLKYDNYKKFIDFIESSEELKFAYKIPFENGEKEYLKDIVIQSITKTEIQPNKVISESIVIDCLSLWYEKSITVYSMTSQEDEIKWNFKWDSKFANYNVRRLNYINEGHTEAPIVVRMGGNLVNPKIQLYVEGELYQDVTFNVELDEYEGLLYCTKENEFYLKKENVDGTYEDLFNLDVIDPEVDNVIRIPQNKSCELRLTADNDVLNAQITIFTYYKAV